MNTASSTISNTNNNNSKNNNCSNNNNSNITTANTNTATISTLPPIVTNMGAGGSQFSKFGGQQKLNVLQNTVTGNHNISNASTTIGVFNHTLQGTTTATAAAATAAMNNTGSMIASILSNQPRKKKKKNRTVEVSYIIIINERNIIYIIYMNNL